MSQTEAEGIAKVVEARLKGKKLPFDVYQFLKVIGLGSGSGFININVSTHSFGKDEERPMYFRCGCRVVDWTLEGGTYRTYTPQITYDRHIVYVFYQRFVVYVGVCPNCRSVIVLLPKMLEDKREKPEELRHFPYRYPITGVSYS